MLPNCCQHIVISTLVLMLLSMPAASREQLKVGWEHYPPQQWQDQQGEIRGVDIEVIRAIAERAGFDLEFVKMPWRRLVNVSLRQGDIDIALDAARIDAINFVHYSSIPYFPSDSALFIREDDEYKFKSIKRLPDLMNSDLKIGVIENFNYSKEYDELLYKPAFKNKLTVAKDEELCFKMLLASRVDGILLEHYSFKKMQLKMQPKIGLKLYSDLDMNEETSGSYIIYSKASVSDSQLKRMNQALEGLKRDGSLSKIIDAFIRRHIEQM